MKNIIPFKNMTVTLAALAVFALLTGGCATNKMALDAGKGSVSSSAKPIGIFTLRTANDFKPSFLPEVAKIEVLAGDSGSGRKFKNGKPYQKVKKQYCEYLVSVALEPGAYTLGDVAGTSGNFLISGHFKFPAGTHFSLSPGSISYLGHVVMTNRQRAEGERRSGSIFPLIDQSVCGFSSGTFDVSVVDRSDTDIPAFIQAYPWLQQMNITKAIMQK